MQISEKDLRQKLKLHHEYYSGYQCGRVEGEAANLEMVDLSCMDLQGVELRYAPNLRHVNFSGSDLSEAKFVGSNLECAIFIGAHMEHTNFETANLRGADLSGGELCDAWFENADLRFASLKFADARFVNFCGADLKCADLFGTDLSDCEFEGAVYDRNTRWPNLAFDPKKLGAIFVEEEELFYKTPSFKNSCALYDFRCELFNLNKYQQLREILKKKEIPHYCKNCGRLLNKDNCLINDEMCQGCQTNGIKKFILWDWFTGGRFFR